MIRTFAVFKLFFSFDPKELVLDKLAVRQVVLIL